MSRSPGEDGKTEDETPMTPTPKSPNPEIFSTKKIFFLSSNSGNRRSEIPNIELDYCPRDEASRRLFQESRSVCNCSSDGLTGCLRRNKQCLLKVFVLLLTVFVVLLLISSISYNLTRTKGPVESDESITQTHWNSHYHNYTSHGDNPQISKSENNDEKPSFAETDFHVPIYEVHGDYVLEKNVQKHHYEAVELDDDGERWEKFEPLIIHKLKVSRDKFQNSLVIIPDEREPSRQKRSPGAMGGTREAGVEFPDEEKWREVERRLKLQREYLREKAKTVFQPFIMATPPYSKTLGQNSDKGNGDSSSDSRESKSLPDDDSREINKPELEEEQRLTTAEEPTTPGSERLGNRQTEVPDSPVEATVGYEEAARAIESPPTGSEAYSQAGPLGRTVISLPGTDYSDEIEGISLTDAIKRKESNKYIIENSRVVGGSSDVRLPTGPDVSRPPVNAFESLKTGQQLSFAPSAAASQLVFPYQMCLFASPYQGLRPTTRDSAPRTFHFPFQLKAPALFTAVADKDDPGKPFPRYPPQQNFLSFSINNYANPPPRQFMHYPPTGTSFFNFPPIQQNGPLLPNSQPIFCTYLQPPLFQFPTVPGTADFTHSKCTDCEENPFFKVSSLKEKFYSLGRRFHCMGDDVPCRDGSGCIPFRNWCDNKVHCPDVSDEAFCSCRERIARVRLCDGYLDCPNGEDEVGCFDCPNSAFSCDSIIKPESCIPLSRRCDGARDCPTGNDEIGCSALFFNVHGNGSHQVPQVAGYLHQNWRGNWFPVCVDMNNDAWAKEACLGELGYFPSDVSVSFAPVPTHYKGPFIVRNAKGIPSLQDHCKGHLSTYVKCPYIKCGTRGHIYSQQEFANRFKRIVPGQGFVPRDPVPVFDGRFFRRLRRQATETGERSRRKETGRVVGGRESEPRAWPWAIAIYKDGGFLCGGVILHELWVLTAAHCMEHYWKHFYEVRGGMLRRFSFSPMEQVRAVGHVIVHENYDPNIMSNDLALLRLSEPFHFNRWVRPACLPSLRDGIFHTFSGPLPGTLCVAVGWGALKEHGIDADQLREVEVPIMIRCKHKEDVAGAEICAGKIEGGKDTCQGDSGGPLLCRNLRMPLSWYVAGIVSHGEGCARPGEPGAYTRVSLFLDWITANANDFKLPATRPVQRCPGFRCTSASKLCIPANWRCNGYADCLEAEDERNCTGDRFVDPFEIGSIPREATKRMKANSSDDSGTIFQPVEVSDSLGRHPQGILNKSSGPGRQSAATDNSPGLDVGGKSIQKPSSDNLEWSPNKLPEPEKIKEPKREQGPKEEMKISKSDVPGKGIYDYGSQQVQTTRAGSASYETFVFSETTEAREIADPEEITEGSDFGSALGNKEESARTFASTEESIAERNKNMHSEDRRKEFETSTVSNQVTDDFTPSLQESIRNINHHWEYSEKTGVNYQMSTPSSIRPSTGGMNRWWQHSFGSSTDEESKHFSSEESEETTRADIYSSSEEERQMSTIPIQGTTKSPFDSGNKLEPADTNESEESIEVNSTPARVPDDDDDDDDDNSKASSSEEKGNESQTAPSDSGLMSHSGETSQTFQNFGGIDTRVPENEAGKKYGTSTQRQQEVQGLRETWKQQQQPETSSDSFEDAENSGSERSFTSSSGKAPAKSTNPYYLEGYTTDGLWYFRVSVAGQSSTRENSTEKTKSFSFAEDSDEATDSNAQGVANAQEKLRDENLSGHGHQDTRVEGSEWIRLPEATPKQEEDASGTGIEMNTLWSTTVKISDFADVTTSKHTVRGPELRETNTEGSRLGEEATERSIIWPGFQNSRESEMRTNFDYSEIDKESGLSSIDDSKNQFGSIEAHPKEDRMPGINSKLSTSMGRDQPFRLFGSIQEGFGETGQKLNSENLNDPGLPGYEMKTEASEKRFGSSEEQPQQSVSYQKETKYGTFTYADKSLSGQSGSSDSKKSYESSQDDANLDLFYQTNGMKATRPGSRIQGTEFRLKDNSDESGSRKYKYHHMKSGTSESKVYNIFGSRADQRKPELFTGEDKSYKLFGLNQDGVGENSKRFEDAGLSSGRGFQDSEPTFTVRTTPEEHSDGYDDLSRKYTDGTKPEPSTGEDESYNIFGSSQHGVGTEPENSDFKRIQGSDSSGTNPGLFKVEGEDNSFRSGSWKFTYKTSSKSGSSADEGNTSGTFESGQDGVGGETKSLNFENPDETYFGSSERKFGMIPKPSISGQVNEYGFGGEDNSQEPGHWKYAHRIGSDAISRGKTFGISESSQEALGNFNSKKLGDGLRESVDTEFWKQRNGSIMTPTVAVQMKEAEEGDANQKSGFKYSYRTGIKSGFPSVEGRTFRVFNSDQDGVGEELENSSSKNRDDEFEQMNAQSSDQRYGMNWKPGISGEVNEYGVGGEDNSRETGLWKYAHQTGSKSNVSSSVGKAFRIFGSRQDGVDETSENFNSRKLGDGYGMMSTPNISEDESGPGTWDYTYRTGIDSSSSDGKTYRIYGSRQDGVGGESGSIHSEQPGERLQQGPDSHSWKQKTEHGTSTTSDGKLEYKFRGEDSAQESWERGMNTPESNRGSFSSGESELRGEQSKDSEISSGQRSTERVSEAATFGYDKELNVRKGTYTYGKYDKGGDGTRGVSQKGSGTFHEYQPGQKEEGDEPERKSAEMYFGNGNRDRGHPDEFSTSTEDTSSRGTSSPTTEDNRADPSDYYQCRRIVQSVLRVYRCDDIRDCEDGTDEEDCCSTGNSTFPCSGDCSGDEFFCHASDKCVPSNRLCDGSADCPLAEDERNCLALSETRGLAFDGGRPVLGERGFVFANRNGVWSPACQTDVPFDEKLAKEVCSDLGWVGYDRYENVSLSPSCMGLFVVCSRGLRSELDLYRARGKDYFWPWNSFVYSDGKFLCSAVLLRSDWLLASSACVQNQSLDENYLTAKLGGKTSDLKRRNDNEQTIRIDGLRRLADSDMALLHLSAEANQTRFVRALGVPYVFESDPSRDVCVTAGSGGENVFLNIQENCPEVNVCYNRTASARYSPCKRKPSPGIVVCQSRVGWYPSSTYPENEQICSFGTLRLDSVKEYRTHLYAALDEKIEPLPEPLCSGFRCPEGFCIPAEKMCDGTPDCYSRGDEDLGVCDRKSAECGVTELKCRNGLCVPKFAFADGKDDCGDGSDEPPNATCFEYLKLTDPAKICNGKRNCFDKTDEDFELCPCDEHKFSCNQSRACVPMDFVCDGENDCPEGEDENNCVGHKIIHSSKSKSFEIMEKSYGVWHNMCPTHLSAETSQALCQDLGFTKSVLTYEKNQTVLLPHVDPFSWVKLNRVAGIALRADKPFVKLVKVRKACKAVKCV